MVSSVSFSKSEKQRHGVLYTLEAACNKILNESGENGLSSQSSQRLLGRKLAEFEAELKRCQNAVGIRVSKLSGDKREQALSSWEELSSPWESWLTNSFILLENAKADQEEEIRFRRRGSGRIRPRIGTGYSLFRKTEKALIGQGVGGGDGKASRPADEAFRCAIATG